MLPALTTKRARVAAAWVFLAMFLGGTGISGRASAAAGEFLPPVSGSIVLRFTARYRDAAAGKTRTHHGIDIVTAAGSRVKAAADGKVTFAGWTPLGMCVAILHKNGIKTTYLPLESIGVSRGDTVSQGRTIGIAAATGDVSGSAPHLHLGAIFAGEYIDPESLLMGDYKADLTRLIRRGNIPPGGDPTAMTAAGRISSWPVVSVIVRLLNGGANLINRFWGFLGNTGSFLAMRADSLFQTGLRFIKKGLSGFGGAKGARRFLPFTRTAVFGFRRPVTAGPGSVVVFDPSGDRDEPDSCLFISLTDGQAAILIDIYNANAVLVRRLEGWDQSAGGVYWSGDDIDGRIVGPGLYSIVIRSVDGSTRVILAEVRWHL